MISRKKPLLFAHRGASGYEHENTMVSFQRAIDLGADGLETDVFEIATGELIIYHDSAIALPGASQNTPIAKLTNQDLAKIILPNGEHIPLLEDFLSKFSRAKSKQGNPIEFSIDIQNSKAGPSIAKKVVEFGLQDRAVLCSTTPSIVFKKIRMEFPDVRLVASNCETMISIESCSDTDKLGSLNIYAYNFQKGHLTKHIYDLLKTMKKKIFMWDLHEDNVLHDAILEFELDAVYSNYPDRARRIIDEIFQ